MEFFVKRETPPARGRHGVIERRREKKERTGLRWRKAKMNSGMFGKCRTEKIGR